MCVRPCVYFNFCIMIFCDLINLINELHIFMHIADYEKQFRAVRQFDKCEILKWDDWTCVFTHVSCHHRAIVAGQYCHTMEWVWVDCRQPRLFFVICERLRCGRRIIKRQPRLPLCVFVCSVFITCRVSGSGSDRCKCDDTQKTRGKKLKIQNFCALKAFYSYLSVRTDACLCATRDCVYLWVYMYCICLCATKRSLEYVALTVSNFMRLLAYTSATFCSTQKKE